MQGEREEGIGGRRVRETSVRGRIRREEKCEGKKCKGKRTNCMGKKVRGRTRRGEGYEGKDVRGINASGRL